MASALKPLAAIYDLVLELETPARVEPGVVNHVRAALTLAGAAAGLVLGSIAGRPEGLVLVLVFAPVGMVFGAFLGSGIGQVVQYLAFNLLGVKDKRWE